jgi:hypothetical protein
LKYGAGKPDPKAAAAKDPKKDAKAPAGKKGKQEPGAFTSHVLDFLAAFLYCTVAYSNVVKVPLF